MDRTADDEGQAEVEALRLDEVLCIGHDSILAEQDAFRFAGGTCGKENVADGRVVIVRQIVHDGIDRHTDGSDLVQGQETHQIGHILRGDELIELTWLDELLVTQALSFKGDSCRELGIGHHLTIVDDGGNGRVLNGVTVEVIEKHRFELQITNY